MALTVRRPPISLYSPVQATLGPGRKAQDDAEFSDMSHIAYVNGRYLPHREASVHIEDRGYQFADGVYEVVSLWNGIPVDYGPHIVRLKRSLDELRMKEPMSPAALTVVVREVVRRNRFRTGIIYIQINRGVAPRAHTFPGANVRPSVVVTAKAFPGSSDAMAEQGAKVVTARDIRWERRDIKSIGLLANAMARQSAAEQKAYEAILVKDDGTVTEASASNAWIITADKTIVTHPTGNTILGGITRSTVIKLAKEAGHKVTERPFTLDEARNAKEVFLTGTTTFVMPVTQIDDQPVANGAPGLISLDLRKRYRNYMDTLDPATAWNV
jgi:D-alanine transaminase